MVPATLTIAYMHLLVSRWAADAHLKRLDVVFRGLLAVDQRAQVMGVITDKDDTGDTPEVCCDLYVESLDGVRLVGGQAVVELPFGHSA